MGNDSDIAAVLWAAANAWTRERKKAALVLANTMRRVSPIHENIDAIAAEVSCRYGDGIAGEVRAIVAELHLG